MIEGIGELLSLARPAFALFRERATSVNTNYPFHGYLADFFLSQLAEVCCHSFPEPARSQGVREAVCPCCTQTGSARSHLASATHLFSWDPETSVVHAVSSTPQSSGLEEMGSVPSIALGLTHPGCSWVTR